MNDLSDAIKDMLGQNIKIRFHVPVDDNAQFQYEAKFGREADLTVNSALIVSAPQTTPIKLYSAFRGQLFFSPSPFADPNDHLLALYVVPVEALALSTLLPQSEPWPVVLVYYPVDLTEAEKAIEKTLTAQGLAAAKQKSTQTEFMAGETGVFVQAGQWIGTALGGNVTVCFEDANGYMLHPRYLLWLLWKSASNQAVTFEPTNHSLVAAMQLPNSVLTLTDSIVTLPDTTQESFSLAYP